MARGSTLWPLRIGVLLTVIGLVTAFIFRHADDHPDPDPPDTNPILVRNRPKLTLLFDFAKADEDESIGKVWQNNLNFGLFAVGEGDKPANCLGPIRFLMCQP